MIDLSVRLERNERLSEHLCLLRFEAPRIAEKARPGQFVAIRASEGIYPLLRRPMSIYMAEGPFVELLIKVVGPGTRLLYEAEPGRWFRMLGPLGRGFGLEGDFDLAVLFGGGVGVAPLAFLERELRRQGRRVLTLVGARTAGELVLRYLSDPLVATDDGSAGFRGTVLELWRTHQEALRRERMRWFSCGPMPMLRALAEEGRHLGVQHEVALEVPMGCGFGVCQGCIVPRVEGRYALACLEGPVFSAREVRWDVLCD
jgi:dihydroorotate dehydrogenase electron transfer subunit|nr:MAG: dihydroorotate dehydrogenase B (NAD(+)), electron transfer subunit [Bacteroidota bacterium]